MVPSDSTKVTCSMQDCTAFMPAFNRSGAISVDIGHCSAKTRMLASSTARTVEMKLADIAVSLSDNFKALVAEGQHADGSAEVKRWCIAFYVTLITGDTVTGQ